MTEYKVTLSLSTDALVDFSEKFMETLREIGLSNRIKISADIPIAKLIVNQELGNDIRNKIEGYLSRKFKEIEIKGLKVLEIKLKLKEEEDGS